MTRAITSLFAAPFLVALGYGLFAIFAVPVMLLSALVFGLPLFLLLRRFGWLHWAHALASGLVCSIPFAALYFYTSDPYHIEYTGWRNTFFLCASGSASGLLFWLFGVFRNPEFNRSGEAWPLSLLLVLPVIFFGYWYWQRLEPVSVYGRVTEVLRKPTQDRRNSGLVAMRLANGSLVTARLPSSLANPSPVGVCFWSSERWAANMSEHVYFLHAPKWSEGERGDC